MNKRSAIALAGGTAAALVSGVAGYSLSLTQATAQATTATEKPIVRTEVRTITIHKKPKVKHAASGPSAPVTITLHRSSDSSGSQHPSKPPAHHSGGSGHHGGGGDDDGHEDHGGDDHGGGGDD